MKPTAAYVRPKRSPLFETGDGTHASQHLWWHGEYWDEENQEWRRLAGVQDFKTREQCLKFLGTLRKNADTQNIPIPPMRPEPRLVDRRDM